MADIKKLAEQLVNLTIKEANELAKVLEDEYGIKPAAAAVAVVSVHEDDDPEDLRPSVPGPVPGVLRPGRLRQMDECDAASSRHG